MVKVHIWLPDEAHVGHTAITIGDTYISFWPAENAGKKSAKYKTTQRGALNPDLATDIKSEGDRQPKTIMLSHLAERKMLILAADLTANTPRYQIMRNNCSHIVVQILMEGTDLNPSFIPNAGEYGRLGRMLGQGVWTPAGVQRFVEELKRAHARSLPHEI